MASQEAAQRLRIAIALAAVYCKPASQSYESYILHLCAKFPLRCSEPVTSEQDRWRERITSLEIELAELRERYDAEHIEVISLRAATPQTNGEPPVSSGDKKKQKKKAKPAVPASSHGRPDLKGVLNGEQFDSVLSHFPSGNHLLSSLGTLEVLLSAPGGPEVDDMVMAFIRRAVDALGNVVLTLLPPNPVRAGCSDALTALATLAERLLVATLPILATSAGRQGTDTSRSQFLEDVVGHLTVSILVPLIGAFTPLSTNYLSALLSDDKKSKAKAPAHSFDARPDVFAAFEKIMAALVDVTTRISTKAASTGQSVKYVLTLQAARSLQELYTDAAATAGTTRLSTSRPGVTPETRRRVDRLARKDALWYLCSILHLVSGTSLPASRREQDGLLEDEIYATLSVLLRRTRMQPAANADAGAGRTEEQPSVRPLAPTPAEELYYDMDEVERGMVLAVVERVWLGT